MSKTKKIQQSFLIILLFCFAASAAPKWTEKQANDWYAKQPFLVGSNYVPASAINELEMWQADTFDAKRIDLELGWAESLGMNTMRVFCTIWLTRKTQTVLKNGSTHFWQSAINIESNR